ncbi:hypothetical protein [Alteromonas macleodii]|uniref:hypothetical protein n=1 Tax=Alteromonas macleodii TaxID=28108 RepID=UPI00313EA464
MRIYYDSLFNACLKMSGKWVSLSNAIIAIATINTLWNLAFLLLDYPKFIVYQPLSNRLYLIAFGCLGVGLALALIAFFAMRKLESE